MNRWRPRKERGAARFALAAAAVLCGALTATALGGEWWKPYDGPRTVRENVFEFTKKPTCRYLGNDKYEITFAVKGYCDVTVGVVDAAGKVVRHLASGVLGRNAPPPFQKNSLMQKIYWNGKDDLSHYPMAPGKLRVRVRLGLKPVFDKLLGGSDPKNIPGFVLGVAVDKDGAYVFTRGQGAHNNVHLRKYDHDANYVASLAPPPANLPAKQLGGRTYIEYEPGKKSHHGPELMKDMGYDGNVLPGLGGKSVADIQPAIVNGKIFFCNAGPGLRMGKLVASRLYYVHTDGSTDVKGLSGRKFVSWVTEHLWPRFAASPDGKWLYMTGLTAGRLGNGSVVLRCSVAGDDKAVPFLGKMTRRGSRVQYQPGHDNAHFSNPMGLAVDAAGRIYVADNSNNRIQIFSAAGKYLKTIKVSRPRLLCVHQKTGAIYVQHLGRVRGKTVARITKFASFDKPKELFHFDGIETSSMALDSWSSRPRLWTGGGIHKQGSTITDLYRDRGPSVTVWEDNGKTLKKLTDFDQVARKQAGKDYIGRWSGSVFDHVNCDPTREQVYYKGFRNNPFVFDLKTGHKVRRVRMPGGVNDLAFDKRGYLHLHLDPGFYMPGVGRLDPDQPGPAIDYYRGRVFRVHKDLTQLKEVPYDYGVMLRREHKRGWVGGIPVKDQPGAKYFQDGFGVDMKGNLAVQSNIYYVPKMEEGGWQLAAAGRKNRDYNGECSGPSRYPAFLRSIKEQQKRGEEVYYIARRPGLALAGATIWTYDWTGELRSECAVITGGVMAGVQMDEDGSLYFVTNRAKLSGDKPFLAGRGGNYGTDKPLNKFNRTPVTYTYVKAEGHGVRWLLPNAAVPLNPRPTTPPRLVPFGPFGGARIGQACWTQGAKWLYAGISPAVPAGCTCPTTRSYLDWYKRSYVPENYRYSLGVLDTAGNLILHVGRYGTLDDALKMKRGSADIALTMPRFISGTDNYLAFDDWGERLVVLKLKYHAEATTSIKMK